MQRARVPRAVDLVPLLADAGDGVPDPGLVIGRHQDGHEDLPREVVDGELVVVGVERALVVVGVEGALDERALVGVGGIVVAVVAVIVEQRGGDDELSSVVCHRSFFLLSLLVGARGLFAASLLQPH